MKSFLPRIILGTVLISGAVANADISACRRLGDAAFYAGDYRNAISSYESAMAEALRNNQPDEWADCALNLGVAYLHSGQLEEAREVLQEFRRRHPLRSTGTLEGDMLAAEGKYADAENFFKNLRTADPVMEDARLFSLGTLYMNTGREAEGCELFLRIAGVPGKEWPAEETGMLREAMLAGQVFEVGRLAGSLTVRPESPWRRYAVREAVYALIQLKQPGEAQRILAILPEEWRDADTELLTYLADVHQGKIDRFKANLPAFLEKLPRQSHIRLLELFSKGAAAAGESGDNQFAAALLTRAGEFTAETELKEEIHRQLLIRLLNFDADRAASSAENYYRIYPQAGDRLTVVFNTAGVLYGKKSYVQALKLYAFLADNTAGSKGEAAELRLKSAANAVICAEALKDFAALEKFNRILIQESDMSIIWQCRYAAFLENNRHPEEAGNQLLAAYRQAENRKRRDDIEKVAFLLMEFGIRNDNPVMIREYAQKLTSSENIEYVAAAKVALGELLERSRLYRQGRKYFQQAAAMPVEKYAATAGFKAALMAYKDSNFSAPETAAEFLAFALQYPEYEKTPEALFVAVELFDLAGEKENSAKAAAILREKHASNPAFAVLVLRQAARYAGEAADAAGVIADLHKVEENFAGKSYAAEAALLRAVFADRAGKSPEALQILNGLHENTDKFLAAESLLRTGEILFRMGKLPEAESAFLRSAALQKGSLQSDIALLRAGDCDLAAKAPLNPEAVAQCIAVFTELSESSKFLQIRLEAFCKLGIALEHAGKNAEALSCYEKAVYTAVDMHRQQLFPEDIWGVRSCESALRLIVERRENGALQRGMRLIDQLAGVVEDPEVIAAMRENYRQQFTGRNKGN